MSQSDCPRCGFCSGQDAGRGLLSAVVHSIGFGIPWVVRKLKIKNKTLKNQGKAEGMIIPRMQIAIVHIHTYSSTGNYLVVVMSPCPPPSANVQWCHHPRIVPQ